MKENTVGIEQLYIALCVRYRFNGDWYFPPTYLPIPMPATWQVILNDFVKWPCKQIARRWPTTFATKCMQKVMQIFLLKKVAYALLVYTLYSKGDTFSRILEISITTVEYYRIFKL